MKHFFLFLLTTLTLSCSNDDETPTNPVDQLPPETQIGANTIGCLVNGEVLLPRQNNPLGPSPVNCYYQYLNDGWEFGLGYFNDKNGVRGINIYSNKLEFIEGQSYTIKNESPYNSVYAFFTLTNSQGFGTTDLVNGELKITKLDYINNIISGTFYFDAVKQNTGEIVKIREGRFDMKFVP